MTAYTSHGLGGVLSHPSYYHVLTDLPSWIFILGHDYAETRLPYVEDDLPYSWKILRDPIFEDFEVFCSTSKILSSNFSSQQLI